MPPSFDVLVHITGVGTLRLLTEADLLSALATFADACERDLRAHPELPRLYKSGVRYLRELPGIEMWQLPSEAYALGVADCEDLSGWRRAELRVYEEDPAAGIHVDKKEMDEGGLLYHITVRRGDGSIEDPSKKLGMGGARARDEYERALYRWENRRLAQGYGRKNYKESMNAERWGQLPPAEDL